MANEFQSLTTPPTGDTERLTGATSQRGSITSAGIYTSPSAGTDVVTYTVTDQNNVSSTGTVEITIDPGPTAATGSFAVALGAEINVANIISPLVTPGFITDTTTVTALSAQHGTAFIKNGLDLYYPSGDGTTLDTVKYFVSDEYGDQATGTLMANILPCFATGTRIETKSGLIPVEQLCVGDMAKTISGIFSRIDWIGHRNVSCRSHPAREAVWPVCIIADAFGKNCPSKKLWLSPDHSVFLEGKLVPIKHLTNGHSIKQVAVDDIEYWHVELATHDVLLAEGLPCESYLDTGNRNAFANGGDTLMLHPNFSPKNWSVHACAPLLQDGRELAAIKEKLFRRAGIVEKSPEPILRVRADLRVLPGTQMAENTWAYHVPAGARSLRLMSPQWVPAHCHAASLDRRAIGIRLFETWIDGRSLDLSAVAFFSGFHAPEVTAEGRCRWTDGDSRLVLPQRTSVVTLVFEGQPERRSDAAASA